MKNNPDPENTVALKCQGIMKGSVPIRVSGVDFGAFAQEKANRC